jgi:hypothetical protein
VTAEDALRDAAHAIGQMPETDLQSKFAQLQEARKARTEREVLRQQVEADSVELDEAAYQAAVKNEEAGDLRTAARWYRAAAENDFPGASLGLANVLDALAAEHHSRGETSAEEAVNEDAREWAAIAFAAGEIGASRLMEELDARLEHGRRKFRLSPGEPAAPRCDLGGLKQVSRMERDEMLRHFSSCESCQAELAARHGVTVRTR